MAPDGACGVAQSAARSNAKFEAERFRRDFARDSAGNAKALSNPTTLARAAAPSANAGAAFASAADHEKRARAEISSAKWLRGTPEQCFQTKRARLLP